MANGRPGRKCVDRGTRKDGEPYVTTPKLRAWNKAYYEEKKKFYYERLVQWRLSLTEEEKAAKREAHKLYMRKWTREKRKREILLEMEQRRQKTG